jgi:ribosomal-protein-alanine N-acetyltransferase
MRLEPLRWWHIEQLAAIEVDLFGAEAWSAAMFWNELANGNRYTAAIEGGEVIGYAGLATAPPDEAWVNNIAVRREHQRHGVGRALLETLLGQARAAGLRDVLLEVAVDNEPAQHLYSQYGFATVGVRRGYYQPSNTDALVMRREEAPRE